MLISIDYPCGRLGRWHPRARARCFGQNARPQDAKFDQIDGTGSFRVRARAQNAEGHEIDRAGRF